MQSGAAKAWEGTSLVVPEEKVGIWFRWGRDHHVRVHIKSHTHLIWGAKSGCARKIRLKNVVMLATENGRVAVPCADEHKGMNNLGIQ